MSQVLWIPLLLALAGSENPAATLVDDWHRALRAGARGKVLEMLAPEVTIFESGEAEMCRDEYAREHLGADIEFAAATTETVEGRDVIDLGGSAIVLSRSRTKGTFHGKDVSSRGVETMVLEKVGESWRIRHIHWSSHREAAAAAEAELTTKSPATR